MGWWFGQTTGIGSEALRLLNAPGLWLATSLLLVMILGSWLLLRFTRLGRAHLLTKCAVLSLLAHLLFAIYAWRTCFVQPGDGGGSGGTMMVRLIEQAEQTAPERPAPAELPVWEQFAETREMPEVEPLARPIVEPELELERVFEPVAELSAAETTDRQPLEPLPEVKRPEMTVPELLPVAPEKPEAVSEVAEVVEPETKPELAGSQNPEQNTVVESEPEPNLLATDDSRSPEVTPAAELALPRELATATEEKTTAEGEPAAESQDVPVIAESEGLATESATRQLLELPAPPTDGAANGQSKEVARNGEQNGMASPPELMPLTPQIPVRPAAAALPRPVPAEYSERGLDRRAAAAAARGGSEQTEQAVELALAWLASQQRPDGRWDPRLTGGGLERLELGQDRRGAGLRSDNGITGLALLAFLGAGHTTQQGKYQGVVSRGLKYLVETQATDGFLGGQAMNFERTYCHGMALLALGEALAMTGDEGLRGAVQRGAAYTVNTQSRQDGGWRYQPGEAGDMSQFGWQVLALRSAQMGGVTTPPATRDGMLRFLEGATRGPFRGLGCYRPGEGPSPTMTAEALLCRQLLEQRVDPRTADEASSYLLQTLPSLNSVNEYYWYYGTLALYHTGGRAWDIWNQRLTDVLLRRQVQAGADAGAWPADGMWAGYGGKVFSTAMSTLCLEVYYRYLPLHEQR
jgi:hypothetical protein